MTHTLELTGLREDNPRDFLAALGLLRILDVLFPTTIPKLAWIAEHGIPSISTIGKLPEDFTNQIWQRVRHFLDGATPAIEPTRVMSISSSDLRAKLEALKSSEAHLEIAILSATSGQLDIDGRSRRSEFMIESGQIIPLKGICESLCNEAYQATLDAALID